MNGLFKFTGLAVALLTLANCVPEAPHSNPLDPDISSGSSGVEFRGQIRQKNAPFLPLDNCLITLSPGDKYTYSDDLGMFSFTGLTGAEYRLIISRENFCSDTFSVDTDTVSAAAAVFHLNGKPQLIRFSLTSRFINQWYPDPFYQVDAGIRIADPDGMEDICGVTLHIPALEMNDSLTATAVPDSFSLHFRESDMPDSNIFQLIGKEVYIRIEDKSGAAVDSGPFYLHRIIDESPRAESPADLATVGPQPLFTWQAYTAQFPFTYELSIFYINAGIPFLVYSRTGISAAQQQFRYPDSLQSGQFYWTIAVRDDLGNLSRSREATFLVQ